MNDEPVRVVKCADCGAETVWLLKEKGHKTVAVNAVTVWKQETRYNPERHVLHSQTCSAKQKWTLKLAPTKAAV